MKVREGPKGTKASPTMVPSMFEERIVGCICKRATISTFHVSFNHKLIKLMSFTITRWASYRIRFQVCAIS